MKKNKTFVIILGLLFLLFSSLLHAEDEEDRVKLVGNFEFGYRYVDINGNIDKYYEDLNIRKGPRLLSLNFDLLSSGKYKKYFDLFNVFASTIGGDPFESYGFTLKKHGAFNLRYGHRKSTYYYKDILLPPHLAIAPTSGGDFHTYSFERNSDELYFDQRVMKRAKIFVSFASQKKSGESTTTLDISRDEFELEQPVDELKTEYRAGLQVNFNKFDFYLEGNYCDYENNLRIFLPGFSEGENLPPDFTELLSYELKTPYKFTMPAVIARVNARPMNRIQATVSFTFSNLDMDLLNYEKGLGTNFNNTPLDYVTTGYGQINRKFNLADFDFSYRIHDKVYLIEGFRYNKLNQDGELDIAGINPVETEVDIKTFIYETGVQVLLYKTLSVTGGMRYESREVSLEEEQKEKTYRTTAFFNANYSLSNRLNLMGEYERGAYNEPFTLMSPTDLNRFKIRGKFKPFEKLSLILSYLRKDLKNKDSGGKFNSSTYGLDFDYSLKSRLHLSAGYSRAEIDTSISNNVLYQFVQILWNIKYESANNIFRGSMKYDINKNLSVGAMVYYYKNTGTWGLDWTTIDTWLKYTLSSGYNVLFSYKWNKYNEKKYNFDDYSSSIFTVGFGYNF